MCSTPRRRKHELSSQAVHRVSGLIGPHTRDPLPQLPPGGDGMINLMGTSTEALQRRAIDLSCELQQVHQELRRRGESTTNLATVPTFELARHLFEELTMYDLDPCDLGAVRSYFGWLIDKEVERQARVAAVLEAREEVEARLNALRAAEVCR